MKFLKACVIPQNVDEINVSSVVIDYQSEGVRNPEISVPLNRSSKPIRVKPHGVNTTHSTEADT